MNDNHLGFRQKYFSFTALSLNVVNLSTFCKSSLCEDFSRYFSYSGSLGETWSAGSLIAYYVVGRAADPVFSRFESESDYCKKKSISYYSNLSLPLYCRIRIRTRLLSKHPYPTILTFLSLYTAGSESRPDYC